MSEPAALPLVRAFRFKITLLRSAGTGRGDAQNGGDVQKLGTGAFQECSGLEIEQDVQELLEGGRNGRVVKRVGRAKYQNIVLKRGMFYSAGDAKKGSKAEVNRELWIWLQGILDGRRPVVRYDGVIEVYRINEEVVARWAFERGLPAKIRGPELNAKTGELAIEELHIAHERLRLVRPA